MPMRQEQQKGLYRTFRINRESIDLANRRVRLSFSSETPVERWGENEVLSHEKGDYNFDRISSGNHPLLLGHDEHDPKAQIGVIEEAEVKDRRGEAWARFGEGPLAEEIWKDVVTGIRQNISVGYDITGIVKSDKASDGRVTTRYKWEPTHIAIVPVPADTKVGIGRSKKRLCGNCDGTGSCDECTGSGEDLEEEDGRCGECGGTGRCTDCNGNGYMKTAKSKTPFDFKTFSESAKNLTIEEKMNLRTLLLDPTATAGGGATATATPPDEGAIRTKVANDFKTRAKEIDAIADSLVDLHGDKIDKDGKPVREIIVKMAREARQSDESIEAFKVRCLTDVLNAKPAKQVSMRALGVSEKDEQSYSILRAIAGAAKNRMAGKEALPDENTLEGELSRAIVKAQDGGFGYDQAGFIIPFDAQLRSRTMPYKTRAQRDMQAEVFAQGGAFVPTQLIAPPIEILRNMEVLDQLGVRHMDGLQGNIVIPRQDAAATAYAVSEIGALTASNQILGQIALSPKRIGATQAYSKQFVFQSTPDAESFLRDDLFKQIALQRDEYGLNGQGSASQPLGIMNTPGIGSITFGGTPTWKQIVQMETTILSANVVGPLAYVSTPSTRGDLKTVAVALTGATTIGGRENAIWVGEAVNGYKAVASNQVPNNAVILGNFSDMISASWNGFDVVVDYVTKAVNAEIVITINIWCDFALRHPQAFVVSADAGNQ